MNAEEEAAWVAKDRKRRELRKQKFDQTVASVRARVQRTGQINKPGEWLDEKRHKEQVWEKDWKKFNTAHEKPKEKKKLESQFNKHGKTPKGVL